MSKDKETITVYLAGNGETKTIITTERSVAEEAQEMLSEEQRIVVPVQAWRQILAALVNALRSVEVRDGKD